MARTPIDGNTLICWRLDEDAAPYANEVGTTPALSVNTGTTSATGLFGKCISSVASLISTAPVTGGPAAVTISAWVKLTAHVTNATIISKNYTSDDTWVDPYCGIKIAIQADKIIVMARINSATITLNATANVPLNEWLLVSATYDGASLTAYLNGVAFGTVAAAGALDYGAGRWALGGTLPSQTDSRLNGLIEDVRIDAVVRSAAYLQDLYTLATKRIPLDQDTYICWRMSEAAAPITNIGYGPALNLTVHAGTPTYSQQGIFGSCIKMASATLKSGNTSVEPPGASFTISCWVKFNATGNYALAVVKNYNLDASSWVSPYGSITLSLDGSNALLPTITIAGTQRQYTTGFRVVIGSWCFIALTYDGTTMQWYTNGVPSGYAINTGTVDYGNQGSWCVGGSSNLTGQRLDGWVEDVRIDRVVRSPAYILKMFEAAKVYDTLSNRLGGVLPMQDLAALPDRNRSGHATPGEPVFLSVPDRNRPVNIDQINPGLAPVVTPPKYRMRGLRYKQSPPTFEEWVGPALVPPNPSGEPIRDIVIVGKDPIT